MDDEYNNRRKKYAIMMALRALCVILAACTYTFSIWLALALVAGGAVLPWCAVVIANDGPVRKRRQRAPHVLPVSDVALPPGSDTRTVEG